VACESQAEAGVIRLPYVITLEARNDLAEIFDHIARESEAYAIANEARLFEAFHLLAEFPRAGRERSDLHGGLRGWVVDPYLILYKETEVLVQVVAILHGARDVSAILEKREM
jgi:toxin ParE1/3/4